MPRILSILYIVLCVMTIVDIMRSTKDNEKKVLWIVVVVFLPVVGIILYYAIGRN